MSNERGSRDVARRDGSASAAGTPSALPTRLQDAFNEQIKHELFSAYLYLSMAAYCEERNLLGFARWLRVQAREEVEHAMKFFDFILDRRGQVALQAIDQPPSDFGSPLNLFRQAFEHERQVTGLIHRLYGLSIEEKDFASQPLLQWFIAEQIEEEKITSEVVATLELVGESGEALYLADQRLGQRDADD